MISGGNPQERARADVRIKAVDLCLVLKDFEVSTKLDSLLTLS